MYCRNEATSLATQHTESSEEYLRCRQGAVEGVPFKGRVQVDPWSDMFFAEAIGLRMSSWILVFGEGLLRILFFQRVLYESHQT